MLPLLVLLPVLRRDVTGPGPALGIYLIVLIPSLIALASLVLGQMAISQQSVAQVVTVWASPMHGAANAVTETDWLLRNGGSFLVPFLSVVMLTVLAFPLWLLPAIRLLSARAERRAPGTALFVLILPPTSAAAATLFWHTNSPWVSLGAAIAAATIWTTTVSLPPWVRRLWLIAAAAGTVMAWFFAPLWTEPDKQAWRAAVLGPGV
jgi:hypothetical protein